jgi:replication-associated recombination protein RarA
MVAIYEKLRPQTIDEVVGFRDAVEQLTGLRDSIGWDGQVFWITGGSGNGKTTLARIIAADVATELDTEEIDAQDLTLDKLRDFEKQCVYYPQKAAYALIVNEAHAMNSKTISRLLTFFETPQVQKRATVIFTTTDKGQQHLFDTRFDAYPFLSRAIIVDLKLDSATVQALANHLQSVAQKLKLDGQPIERYMDLLVDCHGNVRAALQAIASGKMKATAA